MEKGFTLVEFAVVLLVVGILITGILKLQELIINSQITSTVSRLENLSSAVDNFIENYNNFPGDMSNAVFRIPECNGTTCNNGNGDGDINVAIGAQNLTTEEGSYFFGQLRAAELLSGFDGRDSTEFGAAFPIAPVGGGYTVGDTDGGAAIGFDTTEMRRGAYILILQNNEDVDADSGVLTNSQAETIDRLLDDGRPDTGEVVSQNDANSCRAGTVVESYDEDDVERLCVIAYRLPQL